VSSQRALPSLGKRQIADYALPAYRRVRCGWVSQNSRLWRRPVWRDRVGYAKVLLSANRIQQVSL